MGLCTDLLIYVSTDLDVELLEVGGEETLGEDPGHLLLSQLGITSQW